MACAAQTPGPAGYRGDPALRETSRPISPAGGLAGQRRGSRCAAALAGILWAEARDDTDRQVLIAEIARLTPAQQKIAARYPAMLPLVLADPGGMCSLVNRMQGDEKALANALAVLCFMSLEHGPADLESGLQTLERHERLASRPFAGKGPMGLRLSPLRSGARGAGDAGAA